MMNKHKIYIMQCMVAVLLLCLWSTITFASTLSTTAVESLLEYQQYHNAEKRIRQQLKKKPENAEAWHSLGQALEGQNQYKKAEEAYDTARLLGYSRNWKSQISLLMFHDSNVVIDPSVLDLQAQDQGDIGTLLKVNLNVNTFQQSWGHSAFRLYAQQMQYQNNSALALGHFGLALQQYVHTEPNYGLFVAIGFQQQTLNKTALYQELYLNLNGTYTINDAWTFILKHHFSKRNYQPTYAHFSGTTWTISPTIEGHYEHIHAQIQISSGQKTAQVKEETYQSQTFSAQVAYHLWQSDNQKKDIAVWVKVKSEGRFYQNVDNRIIIRKPRIRQDTESLYTLGIDFRTTESVFGDQSKTTWRLKGGSNFNVSNMKKRTYTNLTLSKNWKYWWLAVELFVDY